MLTFIRDYFEFDRHKTTFTIEIFAGIATYLSLSYIFIVNPVILGHTGINPSAVLFATVVASTISTIFMGLWAKLPFAVAPGLEMNGYFSFVICGLIGLNWSQALTVVLCSGILNVFFTSLQLRDTMITALPNGMKRALATSIGAIVISIAFQIVGIITYKNDFILINIDLFSSNRAIIMYIGGFIAFVLGSKFIGFPLNIFASLLISFILCLIWKVTQSHIFNYSKDFFDAFWKFDFSVFGSLSNPRIFSSIIVLFIVDFIGGAGKLIGLSPDTDSKEGLPNLKKALYIDGGGTILGACLGTSSLVAFVESKVGINAGGRTGFTAIICASLMAISFGFEPILGYIPSEAAAGVLIYVGYLLMPWKIDPDSKITHTYFDIIVGFIMAIVVLVTFGIDKAMAVGFWLYLIRCIKQKQFTAKTAWLASLAIILTITSFVQYSIVMK